MHHGQSRGKQKNEKEQKQREFLNFTEIGGICNYMRLKHLERKSDAVVVALP